MGNCCSGFEGKYDQDEANFAQSPTPPLSKTPSKAKMLTQFSIEEARQLKKQYGRNAKALRSLVKLQSFLRARQVKRHYVQFLEQSKSNTSGAPSKHFSRDEARETLGTALIRIPDLANIETKQKKHVYQCSGAVYSGSWLHGMRHGEGIMTWEDGASYQGIWSFGEPSKFGKFTHKNGDTYEGAWAYNQMSGYGVFRLAEGTVYRGLWRFGQKHGKGLESFSNGAQYIGDFVNGQKEGEGTYLWADGSRFYGQWKDKCYNGLGILQWKDGRHYIGEFKDGKMHGYGRFVWSDGKRYEGQYKKDVKDGFGIYFLPDGRTYRGFWKNGKQHGLVSYETIDQNQSSGAGKQIRYGFWDSGRRLRWYEIKADTPVVIQLAQIVQQERDKVSGSNPDEIKYLDFSTPIDFQLLLDSKLYQAEQLKKKLENLKETGLSMSTNHQQQQGERENQGQMTILSRIAAVAEVDGKTSLQSRANQQLPDLTPDFKNSKTPIRSQRTPTKDSPDRKEVKKNSGSVRLSSNKKKKKMFTV